MTESSDPSKLPDHITKTARGEPVTLLVDPAGNGTLIYLQKVLV